MEGWGQGGEGKLWRRRQLSVGSRPQELCVRDAPIISLRFRAYQSAHPPLPIVSSLPQLSLLSASHCFHSSKYFPFATHPETLQEKIMSHLSLPDDKRAAECMWSSEAPRQHSTTSSKSAPGSKMAACIHVRAPQSLKDLS